jgi:hypothetical protein
MKYPTGHKFAQALASIHQNDSEADLDKFDPATTVIADILPEESGPEKIEFESAFAKPTVNGQWQPCLGRCFARQAGQWLKVWETAPLDLLFQPLPLVGDFDADGVPEIAILPFHELILLDARNGPSNPVAGSRTHGVTAFSARMTSITTGALSFSSWVIFRSMSMCSVSAKTNSPFFGSGLSNLISPIHRRFFGSARIPRRRRCRWPWRDSNQLVQ